MGSDKEAKSHLLRGIVNLDALAPSVRDYIGSLESCVQQGTEQLACLQRERHALHARVNELKAAIAEVEGE